VTARYSRAAVFVLVAALAWSVTLGAAAPAAASGTAHQVDGVGAADTLEGNESVDRAINTTTALVGTDGGTDVASDPTPTATPAEAEAGGGGAGDESATERDDAADTENDSADEADALAETATVVRDAAEQTETVDNATVVGDAAERTETVDDIEASEASADELDGNRTVTAGDLGDTADAASGAATASAEDTDETIRTLGTGVGDGVNATTSTVDRTTDGATAVVDDTVASVTSFESGDDGESPQVGTESVESDARALYTETTETAAESDADALSTDDDPTVGGSFAERTARAGVRTMPVASAVDGGEGGTAAAVAEPSIDPFEYLESLDPNAGAGGAVADALLLLGLAATRAGTAAAGGGTALSQLLLATLREWLFRLALLAGYSRYDLSDPLENDNRAAIVEAVEETPGINLTSLVEETGLAESTARYHLRVLEHEDLLKSAKVRGCRRFVPATDDDVELAAALEEEATKGVLRALFEHGPVTGTTLSDVLDRDPSTVSHHLSRLAEAGLVERERDGPALLNSLSPETREAFSEVGVGAAVQQHARADD